MFRFKRGGHRKIKVAVFHIFDPEGEDIKEYEKLLNRSDIIIKNVHKEFDKSGTLHLVVEYEEKEG